MPINDYPYRALIKLLCKLNLQTAYKQALPNPHDPDIFGTSWFTG